MTNNTNTTTMGSAKENLNNAMDSLANGFATFQSMRGKIGLIAAAATTAFSFILLFIDPDLSITVGALAGIGAYIIGGGFLMALKTVWAVTKVTFFVVPTWLFGFTAAVIVFVFMLLGVLAFPIIFVLIKYFRDR